MKILILFEKFEFTQFVLAYYGFITDQTIHLNDVGTPLDMCSQHLTSRREKLL